MLPEVPWFNPESFIQRHLAMIVCRSLRSSLVTKFSLGEMANSAKSTSLLSCPRKRESRVAESRRLHWTPAFAGVTIENGGACHEQISACPGPQQGLTGGSAARKRRTS